MKILFLTDNFPPEVNAPATRTHFHCKEWARIGAEVTIITCVPNYPRGEVFPGYRNRLYQVEEMDGLKVIRVWTFMAPNAGFARRILDYASFAASATVAGLVQDFDVLVATSPQFFTAMAGAVVAKLKRRPWVFELRDLWPESIVATGAMTRGLLIKILERLELRLYRSADLVVAVTRSFKRQLCERGIDSGKIRVIMNGVDVDAFANGMGRGNALRETRRPFRVGYLGTHGLAHALDVILRTAALFDPDEVQFVLVGDGADKARLVSEANSRCLENVRFLDPIPRERVADMLASFDAALVPLRDSPTFRSVIPSKIFEAAAALRPILLGVRGESQELVERYGAGLAFAPEDERELADRIRRLRDDTEIYAELQDGAGRLALAFDRGALAEAMFLELQRLCAVAR